jgi:two-component system, OmpR family, response regulator CpxR
MPNDTTPMSTRYRLLICDDDAELCEVLSMYLEPHDFDVSHAYTGYTALRLIETSLAPPDVIVLDEMLPDIRGVDLLPRIASACKSPVLMLSACGESDQRINGLAAGADDYVVKPCVPAELLLRLKSLCRRSFVTIPSLPNQQLVRVDALQIYVTQGIAQIAQRTIKLTPAEFAILYVLAVNAGSVVSKVELCQKALQRPLERYDRSIDVHVSRLRRIMRSHTSELDIDSIRSQGYVLRYPLHTERLDVS